VRERIEELGALAADAASELAALLS
jgi:hypothetical protein